MRGEVLLIRVEDLFSLEIFYSSTCNILVGTHISFPFSVFCIFHPYVLQLNSDFLKVLFMNKFSSIMISLLSSMEF